MSESVENTPISAPEISTETPVEKPAGAPEVEPTEVITEGKVAESGEPKVDTKVDNEPLAIKFPYTFTTKIDGSEMEVVVKSPEELHRMVQLREASDKRFKEASDMRKQAQELIDLLKKNPRAALEHPAVGHDVYQLAEKVLSDKLEEEMLSAEEKEIRQLRRELANREQQETKKRAEEEAKSLSVKEQEMFENYKRTLEKAVEIIGFPKNRYVTNRLVSYMEEGAKTDYDYTPQELAERLRKDYEADFKAFVVSQKPDALAKFLGADTLKGLRRFEIDALKGSTPPPPEEQPPVSAEKKAKKALTLTEVMAEVRKNLTD